MAQQKKLLAPRATAVNSWHCSRRATRDTAQNNNNNNILFRIVA